MDELTFVTEDTAESGGERHISTTTYADDDRALAMAEQLIGATVATRVSLATPVDTRPLWVTKAVAQPKRRGLQAGVRVAWLKRFVQTEVNPYLPRDASTLDVVLKRIRPATRERKCRYVEQMEPGSVGTARAFASHTWRAPFRDLVAAICHVLEDDEYVWLDVFAVLQWNVEDGISDAVIAEKVEDLDFRAVVRACDLLILVGAHVEAVAKLSWDDAYARRAPEEAKLMCAFFRVWCLVELASALEAKKPVVMLVGAAAPGDALRFVPNKGMLEKLHTVVDVAQAAATVEADRTRILAEIDVGAVNTLASGATMGAFHCMEQREVLQAAAGNGSPLAALRGRELEAALRAAAAGGLMEPLRALLARGSELDVDAADERGWTALRNAAKGGHAETVALLLKAGAQVDPVTVEGNTPLMAAAFGGHAETAALLLKAGAQAHASNYAGLTSLHQAEKGGHAQLVELLSA